MPAVAPYGSWKSPITSDLIVAETIGLADVILDGNDIYWIEARPREQGRYVVVRRDATGQATDQTPPPLNARTRVHEYGGAAVGVADGVVYFSNFADQQLYRQPIGSGPKPITPANGCRYADGIMDGNRQRWIAVREDHSGPDREPVNTIVAVSLGDPKPDTVLVEGNDFYSNPRLSPDGSRMSWLAWNHPNMPWTGTELWSASVSPDGMVQNAAKVAGGPKVSIFQPEWSPDGVLYYVSDESGWWNLYRYHNGRQESLCPMEGEFGRPQWQLGVSTYAFLNADQLVCAYLERGLGKLARFDVNNKRLTPFDLPFTDFGSIRAQGDRVVFRAGAAREPAGIVQLTPSTGKWQVLRRATEVADAMEGDRKIREFFSAPEPVEFPTENGLTAHGLYYRPHHPNYTAPPDELPPLVVKSHGGPTGAASSTLDLRIQFWTSRGIAVLDVNYGGSTGYGRAYTDRLNLQWGIVDVDDCVNGAKHLAAQKRIDPDRAVITGGSAGGYTTLAALTFRDFFKAGASHYGVSDLGALVRDTHKFESRYLDGLIGPYPEQKAVHDERSPVFHTERLNAPVIFFQGDEDEIVPPNQTEMMVDALRAKNIPVGYLLFAGEQHGFRKGENIKRALDAELYFYSVLVFKTGLFF